MIGNVNIDFGENQASFAAPEEKHDMSGANARPTPRKSATAKAATLVDVAKAAQVSVSTAARVLRREDYPVAEDLRERVNSAAARLGYVPNMLARTLRGGTPTAVGLVVGDMLDPYYGEIAEAITERAESAHSIVAIVCNMQRDPLLEIKYCRQLWEHRVAGMILTGGGFDQWSHLGQLKALVQQMTRAGIVVVTLSPRELGTPEFCVDNERVGEMLAQHLVEHGHRRVGVLLGPPEGEVSQQRLRGVSRALSAAGARFQVVHSAYQPQFGAAGVARLLDIDSALTGFITGSDMLAIGVLEGLAKAGRAVPRDASVVSVGNTLASRWTSPRLDTIDARRTEWGRAALDHVVARIAGDEPPAPGDWQPLLVRGGSVTTAAD